MTYQVLARKWRPKKFADLVGQEHVVRALVNALAKGHLHHAYLLTGTRGVGKTTIARILAKSLNCTQAAGGEPCCQCDTCRQIDAGRFVDVLEIDAASNTGIDNIREVLENAQYAPTMGCYKVYIIDEVHMLSKSAFNAMLKTLEEPPEHVKFILATTDPQKVPVTVLSRCLQFVLRNLNGTQIVNHLMYVLQNEHIAFEEAALQLLGRAAAGSMRDALSLLDQAIAMGSGQVLEADVRHMIGAVDKSYLYELLTALAGGNGQALLDQATVMAGRAIGFDSALNELALVVQQLSLLQLVPDALTADDPEYPALKKLAGLFSAEQLQLYYQCILHGKADLPLAPDEYAGFVMTLLRMLAFAPVAAAAVPLSGQISGSQLHNAVEDAAGQAEVLPTVAAEATMVPQVEILPWEEQPAQVTEVRDDFAAAAVAAEEAEAVFPAEVVPVQTAEHPLAATAVQSVCETVPAVSPSVNAVAAGLQQETESAAGAAEVVLPPLRAENWDAILKKLAPKLGAIQLFSLHTAIAEFDEQTGKLVLALTEQGEPTADKNRLDRLGRVLTQAYGYPVQVSTRAWLNEETPQMLHQRQQAEQRQQAQAALEADKTVRCLMDTFGAVWLPQSLQLKSLS